MDTKFRVTPAQLAMTLTVPAASKTLILDASLQRSQSCQTYPECLLATFCVVSNFMLVRIQIDNLQGFQSLKKEHLTQPLFPLFLGGGAVLDWQGRGGGRSTPRHPNEDKEERRVSLEHNIGQQGFGSAQGWDWP